MTEAGFDIVTVVFRDEIPLLRLQARSLVKFFDHSAINSIIVIVNDRFENDCVKAVDGMSGDYGVLKSKLRIVRPGELQGHLPERIATRIERFYITHLVDLLRNGNPWRKSTAQGWRGNKGWRMQQAFKLMSVSVCTGSHVLILDAKNHFISPVGRHDLVSADGRARTRPVVPHKAQQKWIVASFQRLGFSAELACATSAPTVTPVVIERSRFAQAVRFIQQKLGPIDLLFALHCGDCTD